MEMVEYEVVLGWKPAADGEGAREPVYSEEEIAAEEEYVALVQEQIDSIKTRMEDAYPRVQEAHSVIARSNPSRAATAEVAEAKRLVAWYQDASERNPVLFREERRLSHRPGNLAEMKAASGASSSEETMREVYRLRMFTLLEHLEALIDTWPDREARDRLLLKTTLLAGPVEFDQMDEATVPRLSRLLWHRNSLTREKRERCVRFASALGRDPLGETLRETNLPIHPQHRRFQLYVLGHGGGGDIYRAAYQVAQAWLTMEHAYRLARENRTGRHPITTYDRL